jgi:protease-4
VCGKRDGASYNYIMKFNFQRTQQILIVVILGLGCLAILIGGGIALSWYWGQQQTESCNVADLQLYGSVVYYPNEGSDASGTLDQTASEDIRQQIEQADADPSIKAILLQVDSPGGDPVAGEDIADALKQSSKPTVVLAADEDTSAAYWASTGAQKIFASADSELVDIGVTESYLNDEKQNEQNGLTFEALTAGQYKDMGNPDAPLTATERALMLQNLNITDQNFVGQVAANRNLSVASVTAIADGSYMEGAMALKDGLIDQIGSIYDVGNYLKGKIGEDVTLCQ